MKVTKSDVVEQYQMDEDMKVDSQARKIGYLAEDAVKASPAFKKAVMAAAEKIRKAVNGISSTKATVKREESENPVVSLSSDGADSGTSVMNTRRKTAMMADIYYGEE